MDKEFYKIYNVRGTIHGTNSKGKYAEPFRLRTAAFSPEIAQKHAEDHWKNHPGFERAEIHHVKNTY